MDGLASNLRGEVIYDNMSIKKDSIENIHLQSEFSNNTPGKHNKNKINDENNLNRTQKVKSNENSNNYMDQ